MVGCLFLVYLLRVQNLVQKERGYKRFYDIIFPKKQEISVTLGYKYRIFPNDEQNKILDHQIFIYNQACNICLNLQQKNWEANKDLDKKDRIYTKASQINLKIKIALKQRDLNFKTVVAQQAVS